MDTREKSARLPLQEAQKIAPGILTGRTKQVRQHWKKRGVPWSVLGPELLADPARPLHSPSGVPTLPAPDEEAVSDPTFRQVWAQVGAIWKYRNTTTKKQWAALVHNVDTFYEKVAAAEVSGKTRSRETKNVTRERTR